MSSSPPSDDPGADRPDRPDRPDRLGRLGRLGRTVRPRRALRPGRWFAAARSWWAGHTLNYRLLVAVLTLLAAVCVAIGAVTTVALHNILVYQLDRQLTATANRGEGPRGRWQPPYEQPPPSDDPQFSGEDFPFPPGVPVGTVISRWSDGRMVFALIYEEQGTARRLAAAEAAPLSGVPRNGEAHTHTLGDLGDYRLVSETMPNGDQMITGLPLADVQQTLWWMVAAEAAVAGAGLIAAGTAGTFIVRGALRPLRRVAATAGRVAELPLHRGEVALFERVPDADTDPRTEVGQVGSALNRMLGHVGAALAARHASETRVRQFVADASHELRTPLAAIRGYAELTRRSREEVPPDLAHALGRVESETTRMTRLVDDLLLLARLDSGRPLATEPVDLSALVVDVVGDAHAAGPAHTWRLDLPPDAVRVCGDDSRLHQAVANLLANARTHTPPGTVVTTGLTEVDGMAELTVTDDGPGIPAELLPEIFERFARGDSSRSRAAGSTGLGLAIVAAVVEAHGGTVTVHSRPGRTAFTVRLPLLTAAA
ncbi:cell wall metabolism sensor histidine kinase WalK [Plantactinospora sp. KBS50]|uniref:sensor histidine kinase n=1 Tax=Plantactinospora sp. KBS50 TaxID=2024580 RepID=UPI000BAAF521|nr:HAMP domain-containing sensor histidine kinase [Plantactinospora sp. KBS50]ASW55003.1 two-component sensor histidine kinase [Plantactinospora sp. KBS50]